MIDELAAYDLLVIDEVHQVGDSDLDRNLLTNLLDRRYDQMRDTILISNEDREGFGVTVGRRSSAGCTRRARPSSATGPATGRRERGDRPRRATRARAREFRAAAEDRAEAEADAA